MNYKRQKIVHVFDEKLCRFCAKSCGSKCYNIFDNLLLYKQKQISFEDVINVVLGLTVESGDGKSPHICDFCKIKLIDFYDFKSQCLGERIEVPASLQVAVIKASQSPQQLQPQTNGFDETVVLPASLDVTVIKPSISPQRLQSQSANLEVTAERPPRRRLLKDSKVSIPIKQNESINVPIVDKEVKAVLVLFISILTKENLWIEHDRKFNKWNGQLFSKTGQKCTIPRKYGDQCGVVLNSFYTYLAHVIIYHLLESFCPQCKIAFVGTSKLADHFKNKCLSKQRALKHEKYRQSVLDQYSS
ncbi:unnamed protein product [Diamesa hyperborea]